MKHVLLFSTLIMVVYAAAAVAADPDEAVKARQVILKDYGKDMKTLGGIAKGDIVSDRTVLVETAKNLYARSNEPWAFFGQETSITRLNNEAKSTIWSDPQGFETAQQNFIKAASELNQIAATGKPDDVKAKIEALGQSCGACHRNFKN